MRIRLDPDAREPLSVQLIVEVERLVERGRLLPGDRLPSVRDLAARLDVAPNTVAKAYRALEGSGLLVGRGRHGTFVADRLPEASSQASLRLRRAARAYARRATQLGFGSGEARRALDRALEEEPGRRAGAP